MATWVLTQEQVEHLPELKDLPGNLDYHKESLIVQSYMGESRKKDWKSTKTFKRLFR